MGLAREVEAALIGLGLGSGFIAIGIFCWWLVVRFRLRSSAKEASSDKKQLSPKEEEERRERSKTQQAPEGPLEINNEAAESLPPARRSTTRTTIAQVLVVEREKANKNTSRNADVEARTILHQPRKSNKGIRRKENGFSKKVKWSDSVVDTNQERKLATETKSQPSSSGPGGATSSGGAVIVDPFAMYDTEYRATYVRNETTAEADRVAGWKRKALLEVQSGGGDDDDDDDGNSVIASLPSSLKDEGQRQTTGGRAHGGFFPQALSCFDCYVSSPQSAEL